MTDPLPISPEMASHQVDMSGNQAAGSPRAVGSAGLAHTGERVHVNFVGEQDHLRVRAGQAAPVWLCGARHAENLIQAIKPVFGIKEGPGTKEGDAE